MEREPHHYTRTGLLNPSRDTKFSGTKGDRKILIFTVELTTSRIGNLTWLIPSFTVCDDHTLVVDRSKIKILVRQQAIHLPSSNVPGT